MSRHNRKRDHVRDHWLELRRTVRHAHGRREHLSSVAQRVVMAQLRQIARLEARRVSANW